MRTITCVPLRHALHFLFARFRSADAVLNLPSFIRMCVSQRRAIQRIRVLRAKRRPLSGSIKPSLDALTSCSLSPFYRQLRAASEQRAGFCISLTARNASKRRIYAREKECRRFRVRSCGEDGETMSFFCALLTFVNARVYSGTPIYMYTYTCGVKFDCANYWKSRPCVIVWLGD